MSSDTSIRYPLFAPLFRPVNFHPKANAGTYRALCYWRLCKIDHSEPEIKSFNNMGVTRLR
jgi:hypothetical protein